MTVLVPAFRFFLRVEIKDKENIQDLSTNVIFALNHISEFDSAVFPCAFDVSSKFFPIYYVAYKRDTYKKLKLIYRIFYFEKLFCSLGVCPVPAETGLRDYEKILAPHIALLKKGESVSVFPEGGISRPGKIREPKGGIIALVKATGLPIVPITLSGHANTGVKDFLLRRKKATLIFGKPIYPEELFTGYKNAGPERYSEIAKERVMKKINVLLEK
jgi:1-acyl-sn-glycerol-3-phosphate acyltransferase